MYKPRKTYADLRAPPLRLPSEQKRRRVRDLYPPFKVIGLAQLLNLAQKCDAKRPCGTCILAECASECIYDDERGPYPAGVHLLYSTGDHPPGGQRRGAAPLDISTPVPIDGVFIDMLSPTELELMCSIPNSIRLATDEPSVLQHIPHNHSSGIVNPLNDPPSTRLDHGTSGDKFCLQPYPHLVPRPYQALQPYQAHMYVDIATCPTTPPPIDVSGNHSRDEGRQLNPCGDTPATNRVSETFSPVASYPRPSFQYPTQHPPQGILPDPHSSVQTNTSITPSTDSLRRELVSVERTATRSSTHTTTSPYRHYPLVSDTSSDNPLPKQRGNRTDTKQARVLNEVYARTAIPSIEEQQELAVRLNITPGEVQIWYISFFTVSTVCLMSPLGFKTNNL